MTNFLWQLATIQTLTSSLYSYSFISLSIHVPLNLSLAISLFLSICFILPTIDDFLHDYALLKDISRPCCLPSIFNGRFKHCFFVSYTSIVRVFSGPPQRLNGITGPPCCSAPWYAFLLLCPIFSSKTSVLTNNQSQMKKPRSLRCKEGQVA